MRPYILMIITFSLEYSHQVVDIESRKFQWWSELLRIDNNDAENQSGLTHKSWVSTPILRICISGAACWKLDNVKFWQTGIYKILVSTNLSWDSTLWFLALWLLQRVLWWLIFWVTRYFCITGDYLQDMLHPSLVSCTARVVWDEH